VKACGHSCVQGNRFGNLLEVNMKVSFIGCGTMGEALLTAILYRGLSTREDVTVSDIMESRRQHLERRYGISVTDSNLRAAEAADVLVLAVQPKDLPKVGADLTGHLKPSQLVLSFVGGASVDTLCLLLNHKSVVRVESNILAQIGQGTSMWRAAPDVTDEQRKWVRSALQAIGREILVDTERQVDAVAAVSGTGPAYVFLFAECLVEAAVHLDLTRDVADELVLQTLVGSAELLKQSSKSLAELRAMVTPPSANVAEALVHFQEELVAAFKRLLASHGDAMA
jgi:pyrroline-5-carboxylate reductase